MIATPSGYTVKWYRYDDMDNELRSPNTMTKDQAVHLATVGNDHFNDAFHWAEPDYRRKETIEYDNPNRD